LPSISPPSSAFQRLAGLIAFTIGNCIRSNQDPIFFFVATLSLLASIRWNLRLLSWGWRRRNVLTRRGWRDAIG
jgi:hypothetical protein